MEIHTSCSQTGRLNAKMDAPQIHLQIQHNLYQNLPAFLKQPSLRKQFKNKESPWCLVEMAEWGRVDITVFQKKKTYST